MTTGTDLSFDAIIDFIAQQVAKKISGSGEHIARIENRLAALEDAVDAVSHDVNCIDSKLDENEANIEDVEHRMRVLEKDNNDFDDGVKRALRDFLWQCLKEVKE